MADAFIMSKKYNPDISEFTELTILSSENNDHKTTFDIANTGTPQFIVIFWCQMYWNTHGNIAICKPDGELICEIGSSVSELKTDGDTLTVTLPEYDYYVKAGAVY